MAIEILLGIAAVFVAGSNGANDNFKGFATVWGSETLTYRRALTLATVATLLGSLMSIVLANSLMQQFSGKGLVPPALAGNPEFIASVAIAAACTVSIATRLGLPVSTTHALLGGLVGAGLAKGRGIVNFSQLTDAFVLPLVTSPIIAAILGFAVYRLLRLRKAEKDCACIVAPALEASVQSTQLGTAVLRSTSPSLIVDSNAACDNLVEPHARVSVSRVLDRVHILTAASICFARGLNDTPKLAALLVSAQLFDARVSFLVIAAVIGIGGVLYARRVAQTMSRGLVRIDRSRGLAANVITASLVIFASKLGMPVSTTQVSVGSIAGTGLASNSINWTTLRGILLSWVATLPIAGIIAYVSAHFLR